MDNKTDYKLHIDAGLIDTGDKNSDGEIEWMGTKKQWNKYEELFENEFFEAREAINKINF